MDNKPSPLPGRILNLSVLATQLLIMAAAINIFAPFFFILSGGAGVDALGADDVMARSGTQYEEQIYGEHRQGFDNKEQLAHRLATKTLKNELGSYFVLMILFILLAFATIRYHLIGSNTDIKPNQDKQKQATKALEHIRQLLGITAPIAIGRHTSFYRSTLVLSFTDYLKAKSGNSHQLAQVRYITHHEMCHKICHDVYLMYMVKIATAFNGILLTAIYGLTSAGLLFNLIQLYEIFQFLLVIVICYGLYRLFFVGFYYFSRFKEHWADEYALLKTEDFEAAKAAIMASGHSKLHPAPALRIDYLRLQQSTLPLQLFLMLNFVWAMSYIVSHHFFKSLFILQDIWFNLAFMLLNVPLVALIARKNIPQATRLLSLLAATLMAILILALASGSYYTLSYNPHFDQSFISHVWDNLQLYHLWFIAVLVLAQWPKTSVGKNAP